MKKLFTLCAAVLAMTATAQNTVALADAHWGFEAGEATTLVGQYNGTDRYVPAGWTSSNGYQSASTQYKPYVVTNGTNIYASEGSQALHLEGTTQANLPYVILPAITGVDNYNDLTLVFKVRPGYWSDWGGGEGMWSKCSSSDCRTIKVGHLTEIPDRENFASSVTNVWDTTFNAAGMFDPATANPFCEVRIPMAGFGQYVAIYCEANANCYFCIDEVSIEGGEPTPTEPYTVKLAQAVWSFSDMNYYELPTYKRGQIHGNSAYGYVPANWCVDNENKRKTVKGSSAYIPFICPNSYAITTDTTQFGMDGDLGLKFYHNPSNYKEFAILPRVTDAAYTNLELEFYARKGVTSTETDYDSKLSIGYLVINDWATDTLNVIDNVVNLQDLTVVNGTEQNSYTKYTISLATVPANGRVVFYDATQANNIVYLDNISIKQKSNSNPDPEPEPEPLTKEALQDSINWWVPSVANAGTTALATFILHFQNGDLAYGYEWDGSATDAMAAMDEIVAADPDLSAEKTNAGTYFTTFTCGELTNIISWGWGVSKNDVVSFGSHNALALADGDVIIFSYDDMNVPTLATLTNVIFVEEKEAPVPTIAITYNLTGCTANAGSPTEYDDEESYYEIYFTLEDGYTFDGAEVSVTSGSITLTDDYMDETGYYFFDAGMGYLFFSFYEEIEDDVVITIVAKEASAKPNVPEIFSAATFEEFTLEENSVYRPSTLTVGDNWLTSGGVLFSSRVEDWGGYGFGYSGIQVVNYANGTAPYSDAYLPAATPAAEGENYATVNIMGLFAQIDFATTTLSGLLINNIAFNIASFQNGDGYARPLGQDDWFKVTFTGLMDGVVTNSIDFYLADYRTAGDWKYVSDWTWVDLTDLGEINALQFSLDGTDKGAWGLNTSAYFCIDNIGGSPTPTNVQNTTTVKVEKVLRNGQVLILRGGHVINVAGQIIR